MDTPIEHCDLYMAVSNLILALKKPCFKWAQNVSFEEPWGQIPNKARGRKTLIADAQWISMGKERIGILFGWLSLKGNPSKKRKKKGATGQLGYAEEHGSLERLS